MHGPQGAPASWSAAAATNWLLSALKCPFLPSPKQPANAGDFWNSFGNLADRDPSNAWRYLNSAQQNPEVFRNKLLVME